MLRLSRRLLPALLLAACAAAAASDAYPNRPIRIVVPFPAGGGADAVTRLAASKLQVRLNQSVVIDNRPGAGSVIGNDAVAKARPDGYTLLLNIPALVQTPHLQAKLPYDPLRDLVPVTTLTSAPVWLTVSTARLQATTLDALQAEAKKAKLEYASWGMGSTNHLYGHTLADALGAGMVHVPYKGGAAAVTALINGEVAAMFSDLVSLRPHLAGGKLRVLASTGTQRHRLTPDVPTLAELGYKGFESVGWSAFFVPAGTPQDIIAKLETEIVAVTRDPDFIARLAELGQAPGGKPQAEFAADVRGDYERWGSMIRKAGIKPE